MAVIYHIVLVDLAYKTGIGENYRDLSEHRVLDKYSRGVSSTTVAEGTDLFIKQDLMKDFTSSIILDPDKYDEWHKWSIKLDVLDTMRTVKPHCSPNIAEL